MECPLCQQEIDEFDFDMELCPTCGGNFDQDDIEDNFDELNNQYQDLDWE